MTLLYPQLPPKRARVLVEELAGLSCRELELRSGIEHRWAIRSATGGTAATSEHVQRLRTAIRRVGADHGYVYGAESGPPLESKRRGSFDAALARCLSTQLEISASEASRPGIWCFLGCVVAPELIRWRFWSDAGTTPERFLGSRVRNMYSRVWWRSRLLRDDSADDPLWLLDALGEDELVQITERPNVAGFRPRAVALGRSLSAIWQEGMPISRMFLLRDVMKRVLRLMPLTAMELMDDDQLETEIASLFRESLRGTGVLVDEQTEEAVAVSWDTTLRWSAVSRERRFALVEALSAEQLSRLEPLVNRTLPDHREYELRWRVHHQLDASLQQVVELVGKCAVEGVDDGQLGPWLAEEPVGSWAAAADPRRAAQLVDTLTKADLEKLFVLFGWPWPASLTWSDAQRQLRRRYNGGWDTLLLALDGNALDQIVARMSGDASFRGAERLRAIARWLVVNPVLDWPAMAAEEAIAAPTPAPAEVRSSITESISRHEAADPVQQSSALSQPLPTPPSFIKNTLIRAGVYTVGQLLALNAESLYALPGIGGAKVETVLRFQTEVAARLGVTPEVQEKTAGDSPAAPDSASLDELDTWLFQALDGRLETAFALRFDGSATLAEVGDALGVSRERARQLLNGALEDLHRRVGATAKALLEEHAGLGRLGNAIYTQKPPPHLSAIASVATLQSWVTVQPGLAWCGTRSSFDEVVEQVVDAIDGRITLSGEELEEIAEAITQESALLRVVLVEVEGWREVEHGFENTLGSTDVRRVLVQRLRDHGRGAHQNEIAVWLAEAEGVQATESDSVAARSLVRRAEMMMDRDPGVVRTDRGTFLHTDHLRLPRATLDQMVSECVKWITKTDAPVVVADLLERLDERGFDARDLNHYELKSLLTLRPEVKALRKGLVQRA